MLHYMLKICDIGVQALVFMEYFLPTSRNLTFQVEDFLIIKKFSLLLIFIHLDKEKHFSTRCFLHIG